VIVLKFGGTSVGSAERVREAAAIAAAQVAPRAVVVSAAAGVTNLLLDAARAAAAGHAAKRGECVAAIHARHQQVAAGIAGEAERAGAIALLDQLHAALDGALDTVAVAGRLSARDSDRVVATGEKAMSVLFAATLRARGTAAAHVWADRVIATDDRHGGARPNREQTRAAAAQEVRPLLEAGRTVVMTGFIGFAPDGSTTTLGRGGSDYSATLLGAALDADEVQIWTDVPGVLSADPRQVADARVVPQIGYDEAQELAHFGAKVLHPRTIRPAVALDIPVRILSTFAPEEPGTLVTRSAPDGTGAIKAVTALRGLILLTVDVPELEDQAGAAAKAFGVIHEEGVEVAIASQASSRRRMTYVIDAVTGGCAHLQRRLNEALVDFEAEVECAEEVAVVAAVGAGAASQPATLAKLLDVLGRAGVPVLASSQQDSNVAIVAAVPAGHAERAVAAIHDTFIKTQPASARGRRPRRAELLAEAVRVG
jgi:aspartate kinase